MAKWKSVDDPELLKKYHCRHVRVLLKNKREWYGWWGDSTHWCVFYDDASVQDIVKYPHDDLNRTKRVEDGEVIGWLPIDTPLVPIPDGWTPASEPPNGDTWSARERNVCVLLSDGRKWYGWHSILKLNWRVFPENADVARIAKNDDSNMGARVSNEVIAWREIEPERKADPRVRYCVAADLPTSITVWHDTFEAADAEAQRLCVKCGKPFRVLKVVEEVKPGNPVITKLEE